MAKEIEFLFDVGSPTTYLAYTQVPGLAQRTGATIKWTPVLLGGVFKSTGNASPAAIQAKSRYMRADMTRYANSYGVPLNYNPYFPINTITLMRAAMALADEGALEPYLAIVFKAMWVDEKNMGEADVLAEVLAAGGLAPAAIVAKAQDDTVKQRLKEVTDDAVARGCFGAPTFFVDGEMFFGQDRLDWIEKRLTQVAA